MEKKLKIKNLEFVITAAGKKVRILAAAVTAFIFIFVLLNRDLYLDSNLGTSQAIALLIVSLICAPGAGLLITFSIKLPQRLRTPGNVLFFFLMPIVSLQMVESLNGKFIYDFSPETFFANYLTILCFYLLFYMITGRFHLVGLLVNIPLYIWGLVNYFIETFRGTPFTPMDIFSVKTGLNVADGYTYSLSWNLILGSLLFLLTYLLNRKIKNVKPQKLKFKIFTRLVPGGFLACMLAAFFFTDFPATAGYQPDFWNQTRGYYNTGSFFNFCLNTKYLHVSQPANYNAQDTENLLDEALVSAGVDPDSDTSTNILTGKNDYTPSSSQETPNIICIMNESFSDLGVLGDFETNEDYMPFIHSLTENTIKGNLYMPVFGAGTSNSEFEFLTGNSISTLPAGCNVYQSYIKTSQSSLVSTLGSLGYTKQAFHPYYKDGWNRPEVYKDFGFDKFTAIEDFIDNDILDTYKQNNDVSEYESLLEKEYPGEDILLRRFVSDAYDYSMVEDMYENRDTSKPFFLFNVTMQNHGGYSAAYSNFVQDIYTTDLSQSYPMANRYLSLVKKSDEAFQSLVEYFSKVDEPTIICMFGDHQPSIENEFYEEVLGSDLNSLTREQEQSRYVTPFVIWANYDIPEATVEKMSANYLSTLLLQTAGLELTDYNKFLASMYQQLPVIDTVGYIDTEDNYYGHDESSDYSDLLNIYSRIQYNNLIDTDNKENQLFYLNYDNTVNQEGTDTSGNTSSPSGETGNSPSQSTAGNSSSQESE